MTKRTLTVFYAHSASTAPDAITKSCRDLGAVIAARSAGRGEMIIKVVPGRKDFQDYHTGNWDEWEQGVSERRNAMTGKPAYDLIVVPGHGVGRATGHIIAHAIHRKRPVMLWNGACVDWPDAAPKPKLTRVTRARCDDPEDYASGWTVEV